MYIFYLYFLIIYANDPMICHETSFSDRHSQVGVLEFNRNPDVEDFEPVHACQGYDRENLLSVTTMLCPPGFYCEDARTSKTCPVGWFCPTGSKYPSPCSRGVWDDWLRVDENNQTFTSDQYDDAYFQYLIEGTYCDEGTVTVSVEDGPWCPEGYYCPTPGQKIVCPKRKFCPEGYTEPANCPDTASCPEGSSKPKTTVALVISVVVIFCIMAFLLYQFYQLRIEGREEEKKDLELLVEKENVFTNLWNTQTVRDTIRTPREKSLTKSPGMVEYTESTNEPKLWRFFDDHTPKKSREDNGLITFFNLSFTLDNGRRILEPISGELLPGSIVAIMGSSGSGKSTFMNRLLGRINYGGTTGGHVRFNEKIHHDIGFLNPGFVPQDDIMHSQLTVRQVLEYQYRLRNKFKSTQKEADQFIDSVMVLLQIEDVQHTIVGDASTRGISGGQKKRVNIAMEIVAYPSLIFLDEPTSGLDASTTEIVMRVLSNLTRKNISIVAVIHQPRWSVFKMFNKVLLLSKGGKKTYFGSTDEAVNFFTMQGYIKPSVQDNVNLADWFIDILSGDVHKVGEGKPSLPNPQKEELAMSPEAAAVKMNKAFIKNFRRALTGNIDLVGAPLSEVNFNNQQSSIWASRDVDEEGDIEMEDFRSTEDFDMNTMMFSDMMIEHYAQHEHCGLVEAEDTLRNVIFRGKKSVTMRDFKQKLIELGLLEPDVAQEYGDDMFKSFYHLPTQTSLDKVTPAEELLISADKFIHTFHERAVHIETEIVEAKNSMMFISQYAIFHERNFKAISLPELAAKIFMALCIAFFQAIIHRRAPLTVTERLVFTQKNSMESMMVCACLMCIFGTPYFSTERLIFIREMKTDISIGAYWLSKQIQALVVDNFVCVLAYFVLYFNLHMPLFTFMEYIWLFFLCSWFGSGLGLLLGQIFPIAIATVLAMIIPLVMGAMFGGANPTLTDLKGSWEILICHISYARYAIESATNYENNHLPDHLRTNIGDPYLEKVGYKKNPHLRTFLVIFFMGLLLRLVSFVVIHLAAVDYDPMRLKPIRQLKKWYKRRKARATLRSTMATSEWDLMRPEDLVTDSVETKQLGEAIMRSPLKLISESSFQWHIEDKNIKEARNDSEVMGRDRVDSHVRFQDEDRASQILELVAFSPPSNSGPSGAMTPNGLSVQFSDIVEADVCGNERRQLEPSFTGPKSPPTSFLEKQWIDPSGHSEENGGADFDVSEKRMISATMSEGPTQYSFEQWDSKGDPNPPTHPKLELEPEELARSPPEIKREPSNRPTPRTQSKLSGDQRREEMRRKSRTRKATGEINKKLYEKRTSKTKRHIEKIVDTSELMVKVETIDSPKASPRRQPGSPSGSSSSAGSSVSASRTRDGRRPHYDNLSPSPLPNQPMRKYGYNDDKERKKEFRRTKQSRRRRKKRKKRKDNRVVHSHSPNSYHYPQTHGAYSYPNAARGGYLPQHSPYSGYYPHAQHHQHFPPQSSGPSHRYPQHHYPHQNGYFGSRAQPQHGRYPTNGSASGRQHSGHSREVRRYYDSRRELP